MDSAYLLALQLFGSGQDELAHQLLRRLGCTYHLSPLVLLYQSTPRAEIRHPADPAVVHSPIRIFKHVLAGSLISALQAGFAPESAFWQEHGYGQRTAPFFSYFYDLGWEPQTTIEAAIQAVHTALQASACAPWLMTPEGPVVVAEWWVHVREADAPHQLHFDVDESRLRQGRNKYQLCHPAVSSVVFLSCPETGGPTLVIDQIPQDDLGQRGWLVSPEVGKLLAFRGTLLHGVLPGPPSPAGMGPSRLTLIIAWWSAVLQPQTGPPGLGSARIVPYTNARHGPEMSSLPRSSMHMTTPTEERIPVRTSGSPDEIRKLYDAHAG
ncbi:hypothetical protein WJX72_010453 [[Myrmecia] bisecta]|uniref:2OG-Fe(II) oxygenase n=1 Tax=[Myrmecia] bisecta TaxID=41462 RepID=A0AAW1P274_9CHLO